MNCQEVMELMQRQMDGDLDQHETSLMMDHVARCPECAAMLARLQSLNDRLTQLPRVEPKFSLVDAILPQLDRLDEERLSASAASGTTRVAAPPVRSERPNRGWMRGLTGAVALGVVALVVLFSQQGLFKGGSNSNDFDAAAPEANMLKQAPAAASSQESADIGAKSYKVGGSEEPSQASGDVNSAAKNDDAPPPEVGASAAGGGTQSFAGAGTDDAKSPDSSFAPIETQKIVAPTARETERSSDDQAVADSSEGAQTSKSAAIAPASTPAAMLVSPDGRWRAVAVAGGGTVQVYDAQNGDALAFESEPREGEIGSLAWDPDSKRLTYVWTDAQGHATALAYDAETKQEITP